MRPLFTSAVVLAGIALVAACSDDEDKNARPGGAGGTGGSTGGTGGTGGSTGGTGGSTGGTGGSTGGTGGSTGGADAGDADAPLVCNSSDGGDTDAEAGVGQWRDWANN